MTNSADPGQLTSSDLNLHCLLRQGMLCSAREGLSADFQFRHITTLKGIDTVSEEATLLKNKVPFF